MKKLIYFVWSLTIIFIGTSCSEDETSEAFGVDTTDIQIGPEGGIRSVRISASGHWTATASEPWVLISPANGDGATVCRIKTDSTLLAGADRTAAVRFSTLGTNEQQVVSITQSGFAKELAVSQEEFDIASYGEYNKRFFDVDVTSNVPFEVEIPDDASWLTYDPFVFDLDRGARPRTVHIRFNWDSNTDPQGREAMIRFRTEEEDMARLDAITVRQDQAPEITDDRRGDSLALITIQRKLNIFNNPWDYSESMMYWDGVELWEEGAEGTTEENVGRVRSVKFAFFSIKEELPDELRYLKYAETISFLSNANWRLYSLDPGTSITQLSNLKNLRFQGIGLTTLPEEFKNLKNLETLDLSGNNFNEIPPVLTPENFPNLRHLLMNDNCRTPNGSDLTVVTDPKEYWGGLFGDEKFPEQILRWDSLKTLRLSVNLLHGEVPDMKGYKTYTQAEVERDTLPGSSRSEYKGPYTMVGTPKVLPVCTQFGINLNYLTGALPEWLLNHPHLMEWGPDILVFPQVNARRADGELPGFDNVPDTPDYYYELYPHKKPKDYDKN